MKPWMQKALLAVTNFLKGLLPLAGAYFLVEVLAMLLLGPEDLTCLGFGGAWAFGLAAIALLLSRLAGRIWFGLSYYFFLAWTMAQTGYYSVFNRMLWLPDIFYAGEGVAYIGDVLRSFPTLWWVGGILLLVLGGVLIWCFPKSNSGFVRRIPYLTVAVLCLAVLFLLPEMVFLKDKGIWGTRSEYAQSSSYRATYNTMYDARKVYDICGVYQLTFRDLWVHEVYPLTPAYRLAMQEQREQIDEYFAQREEHADNEMTGLLQDKHVVLVLMESMDDWMITREDTPTLYWMMEQGINFTDFYTPGYGTARTINSEFCVNTGIYLPTNGNYVFDYVNNGFNQSFAAQAVENGYTAEVFHYNSPDFYSRGAFEPAMGYHAYNGYGDYVTDEKALYDECLLFEIPELEKLFFREGKTFNTIITRSAHLSYVYNEVLSNYALKQYPQYRGKYGSQEEDCARVKAKLVDDLFARLLQELEAHGRLEETVIIGVTDHYTYGYKNTQELYELSGVDHPLLLEKTPCFVWSADCESVTVEKTMNTADFLPTMLNLVGFDSPYSYLGRDAFDPSYEGYVLFPDGSWINRGVVCSVSSAGAKIIQNPYNVEITEDYLAEMAQKVQKNIQISNLLLTADYYQNGA